LKTKKNRKGCIMFENIEQGNKQLRGMEAALGLNWREIKEIRSIIEQDFLARTGS